MPIWECNSKCYLKINAVKLRLTMPVEPASRGPENPLANATEDRSTERQLCLARLPSPAQEPISSVTLNGPKTKTSPKSG